MQSYRNGGQSCARHQLLQGLFGRERGPKQIHLCPVSTCNCPRRRSTTSIGIGQRMFPNSGHLVPIPNRWPGCRTCVMRTKTRWLPRKATSFSVRFTAATSNLNFITKNYPDEKNYVAIAKIMKAYNFQVCVDLVWKYSLHSRH